MREAADRKTATKKRSNWQGVPARHQIPPQEQTMVSEQSFGQDVVVVASRSNRRQTDVHVLSSSVFASANAVDWPLLVTLKVEHMARSSLRV